MRLEPGTRLGPYYDVITAIGAGGMGEVYRARDTRLNRDVAIKVLPSLFSQDPDGKYYVYSYFRELTDLYLVRGLK